jgi:hypothetical protein
LVSGRTIPSLGILALKGLEWRKKRSTLTPDRYRSLADGNRQSLFGLVASRLVENVLSDLNRLDIFVGPVWGYFPMVEIQSSIASVLELPVEGLAGDFLGMRVRLILLCVIRTAVAPILSFY